jgi:hypothetical protein
MQRSHLNEVVGKVGLCAECQQKFTALITGFFSPLQLSDHVRIASVKPALATSQERAVSLRVASVNFNRFACLHMVLKNPLQRLRFPELSGKHERLVSVGVFGG